MGSPEAEPHLFVDESKAREYLLVAATVASAEVSTARVHVRSLRHRGSSTLHMTKESDPQRKRVLDGLIEFGFMTRLTYSRNRSGELQRRADCLTDVLEQCGALGARRLVIERDKSLETHDRQLLVRHRRRISTLSEHFRYDWMSRQNEPLLWVSDAVAWAYSRGGAWRAKASPLIADVHEANRS